MPIGMILYPSDGMCPIDAYHCEVSSYSVGSNFARSITIGFPEPHTAG
jgi:hypothetical protein